MENYHVLRFREASGVFMLSMLMAMEDPAELSEDDASNIIFLAQRLIVDSQTMSLGMRILEILKNKETRGYAKKNIAIVVDQQSGRRAAADQLTETLCNRVRLEMEALSSSRGMNYKVVGVPVNKNFTSNAAGCVRLLGETDTLFVFVGSAATHAAFFKICMDMGLDPARMTLVSEYAGGGNPIYDSYVCLCFPYFPWPSAREKRDYISVTNVHQIVGQVSGHRFAQLPYFRVLNQLLVFSGAAVRPIFRAVMNQNGGKTEFPMFLSCSGAPCVRTTVYAVTQEPQIVFDGTVSAFGFEARERMLKVSLQSDGNDDEECVSEQFQVMFEKRVTIQCDEVEFPGVLSLRLVLAATVRCLGGGSVI